MRVGDPVRLKADSPLRARLAPFADDHIDDALAFLADRTHTRQQKFVAISVMHNLSLPGFIRFADGLFELYDRGALGGRELHWAIKPSYAFDYKVEIYFTNRDVRRILRRLRDIKELYPVERSAIDQPLWGVSFLNLWIEGPNPSFYRPGYEAPSFRWK